jgi:hypothetical protein
MVMGRLCSSVWEIRGSLDGWDCFFRLALSRPPRGAGAALAGPVYPFLLYSTHFPSLTLRAYSSRGAFP